MSETAANHPARQGHAPRTVTVLGSTGSVGTQTIELLAAEPGRFQVKALVAGRNTELLAQQAIALGAEMAVVADPSAYDALKKALAGTNIACAAGPEAVVEAASLHADWTMAAITGAAGLASTLEAIKGGASVALANKEALVCAGEVMLRAVRDAGATLLPVDSEHNGAHQCLRAGRRSEATKLILTASGGPFRNTPAESLETVTPAQALNHPTWKMGNRITIDSATLMNKGFEVIEACWLFDFAPDDVEVVVHPQSTVHAMVEYNDGSVVAQVCATDMRMPIQYALTWPERASAPVPKIDWSQARQWDFAAPDYAKFPLLGLAYEAQRNGGTATCVLNAADEIAVGAFLEGRIRFTAIAKVVRETLDRMPYKEPSGVGDILEVDRAAREVARGVMDTHAKQFAMNNIHV